MKATQTIALFGEAERGEFRKPYMCQSLSQLVETLGNPPPNTLGLYYAIQALLFEYQLIFMRVKEEGFSFPDYIQGMCMLEDLKLLTSLSAVCAPGVGDAEIINAIAPKCSSSHSIFITREADLYDYLTEYHCA